MKKISKILLSLVITVLLSVSVFVFNVSADSVTIKGGNYNVGQEVIIPIVYTGDTALEGVEATVSYNSSVLQYKKIVGIQDTTNGLKVSNGKITFTDINFSGQSKTGSYKIYFTATAAGNSNVSVTALSANRPDDAFLSSSAMVTVVVPKPSENANLASLKVSGAELSPAFSAKTTSYTATVKYPVDKVTVSANVADGGATCVGAGTFDLAVGENSKTITVTAPSGAKKSYTVVIKRLTEEETAALIEQERAADPTLVVIDGVDYHIKNDLVEVTLPEGFTAATTTYKEGEVAAISDGADYTLCYLAADDGSKADWYYIDESGEFKPLIYISVSNKMYILSDADASFAIPQSYEETEYEAANGTVKAYKSLHSELADFYVLSCYIGGETAFYRYDSAQNTIQRAPDFELASSLEAAAKAEQNKNIFTRFNAMNTTGKVVVLLLIFAVLVVVVLVVLLIVKLSTRAEKPMEFIPVHDENIAPDDSEEPFDIFSVTDNSEPEAVEIEDEETPDDIAPDEDDF